MDAVLAGWERNGGVCLGMTAGLSCDQNDIYHGHRMAEAQGILIRWSSLVQTKLLDRQDA